MKALLSFNLCTLYSQDFIVCTTPTHCLELESGLKHTLSSKTYDFRTAQNESIQIQTQIPKVKLLLQFLTGCKNKIRGFPVPELPTLSASPLKNKETK